MVLPSRSVIARKSQVPCDGAERHHRLARNRAWPTATLDRRATLPPVSALSEAPLVPADDRAAWRSWLAANHATARGAWLVTWRRGHGPVLEYEAAVEEALCFGWVDSTAGS